MAQRINVDIVPGLFQQTLFFSQNDIGRTFIIEVVSRSGQFDIPAGATVTCAGTKPSGFGFSVPCTVSGNTVTLEATDTDGEVFTDERGRFQAELVIEYGGDILGTANFWMESEENPHPDGTIDGQAESVLPVLTQLVVRIEEAAESIHELTVEATTLGPGEDATAVYDSDLNKITFGIPRGGDMTCTDEDADGNIVITLT